MYCDQLLKLCLHVTFYSAQCPLLPLLLPSATKLRQGNIFTGVCQSFCSKGGVSQHALGKTLPSQTPPPLGRHPLGRHPLGRQYPGQTSPPADGYCSGRYAFYWNAFLLLIAIRIMEWKWVHHVFCLLFTGTLLNFNGSNSRHGLKTLCVNIKPDTHINVYTRFCLNTAKSKFSLVSPVADWWNTIDEQLNWIVY